MSSRNVKAGKEKVVIFCDELEQLYDISALNAYEQLLKSRRPKWKGDWAFYEGEKSRRKYLMTDSIDLGVSKVLERQKAKLGMDFWKRSTEDQKPSDLEVRKLLDKADEEDQNDTEFSRLSSKKK